MTTFVVRQRFGLIIICDGYMLISLVFHQGIISEIVEGLHVTDDTQKKEALLTFPCKFPIKVIGKRSDDFKKQMSKLFRRHIPVLEPTDFVYKDSKKNSYLALTVTVTAKSQQQLDAIYKDLTASKLVLMAL